MNRQLNGLLYVAALLIVGTVTAQQCDSQCPTLKCYKRRSDSRYKYIQMAGSVGKAHVSDADSLYGVCTVTPGYRSSFRKNGIARCLFGDHLTTDSDCCDPVIFVQGSAVTDRNDNAWLADYFYLPRNYKGVFKVDPTIKTFFLDVDLYLGLEDWLCGLYFRLWGDVVHTKWNLGFCDKAGFDGPVAVDHPHGYFSPAPYEGSLLLQSFAAYAQGDIPKESTNTGGTTAPGAVAPPTGGIANSSLKFQELKYAKMVKYSKSEAGFAELRGELGWDFYQNDCSHCGINLQFAAPTGKKKEPCILFDAMVGNGNHWEIGAGFTGHYVLWHNEESNGHFSVHIDANFTHLFKERVQRTFDLRGKPNSAYMLAARFVTNTDMNPADQVRHTDGVAANTPGKQFAGVYAPVANLSTTAVDVSIGVQSDIVLMFNYTGKCLSWDVGYNFWGHSCEKMDCPESCKIGQSLCNASQQNSWALKGDARMFGYVPATGTATVIPLSATQSQATILNGRNEITTMAAIINNTLQDNTNDKNMNIDSPARAWYSNVDALETVPTSAAELQTSITPEFLSCDHLDFTRIKGISHSFFTNLSYTWERECWLPHVGIGLAAEFTSNSKSCCDTSSSNVNTGVSCGPCVECSVSQWSIWAMAGVSFN